MKKLLSSDRIKAEALRLGFSACGLAPAEAVDETVATAFRQWLADGCQAEMAYMQNYEDKRLDPALVGGRGTYGDQRCAKLLSGKKTSRR